MNLETIDKLCCPFDRNDLKLTKVVTTLEGKIEQGYLSCGTCKRVYPIIRGIPIMNPDEYREFELERPILDRWKRLLPDS